MSTRACARAHTNHEKKTACIQTTANLLPRFIRHFYLQTALPERLTYQRNDYYYVKDKQKHSNISKDFTTTILKRSTHV